MDRGFLIFVIISVFLGIGLVLLWYPSLTTDAKDICETVFFSVDSYFIEASYNREEGVVSCSVRGEDTLREVYVERDIWGSLHTKWGDKR